MGALAVTVLVCGRFELESSSDSGGIRSYRHIGPGGWVFTYVTGNMVGTHARVRNALGNTVAEADVMGTASAGELFERHADQW